VKILPNNMYVWTKRTD